MQMDMDGSQTCWWLDMGVFISSVRTGYLDTENRIHTVVKLRS